MWSRNIRRVIRTEAAIVGAGQVGVTTGVELTVAATGGAPDTSPVSDSHLAVRTQREFSKLLLNLGQVTVGMIVITLGVHLFRYRYDQVREERSLFGRSTPPSFWEFRALSLGAGALFIGFVGIAIAVGGIVSLLR